MIWVGVPFTTVLISRDTGISESFVKKKISTLERNTPPSRPAVSTRNVCAYNLNIEQGATYSLNITVTAVNLTGYTARMIGRTSHASNATAFSLTSSPAAGIVITSGTNSVIAVTLTATQTAALPRWSCGVYDLEYQSAAGVVTRLIAGTYVVSGESTYA